MKECSFPEIEKSIFIFSRKSIIMQKEKKCNGKRGETRDEDA